MFRIYSGGYGHGGLLNFYRQIEVTDSCLLWTGKLKRGYGNFQWQDKTWQVHRLAYHLIFGNLDPSLVIDHLCRVRNCVNPLHMEQVTIRENTYRGEGPAAQNRRKTHCSKGHPFTPENTYIHGKTRNKRRCRICDKAKYLALQKGKL